MKVVIESTPSGIAIGLEDGSSLDGVAETFGKALGSLVHKSCEDMNRATAEIVQPSLMSDCAKQIIDGAVDELLHLGTSGMGVNYKCYKI